jgi:hypothetical protein
MRDPNKITKFVFTCFERDSVEMKLRLKYDNLKQSEFFRSLIRMYIDKDTEMMNIVEKIKEKQKTMGKLKLKRTRQDLEKGNKMLEDLGITASDKQDIFDMIEMDMEEYE